MIASAITIQNNRRTLDRAFNTVFAHWCTIRVSVTLIAGLLVHHPVCR
jgi:hypothetical protein